MLPPAGKFLRETIVRLPEQFRRMTQAVRSRAQLAGDAGLQEQGLVFCASIILADRRRFFFDCWMRLLAAIRKTCCGYVNMAPRNKKGCDARPLPAAVDASAGVAPRTDGMPKILAASDWPICS